MNPETSGSYMANWILSICNGLHPGRSGILVVSVSRRYRILTRSLNALIPGINQLRRAFPAPMTARACLLIFLENMKMRKIFY